jgi:hypothetical protein
MGGGYGEASSFPSTVVHVLLAFWIQNRSIRKRTVALNLSVVTFNDAAEVRPSGQIIEVEFDIICLRKVVQIACVEVEEIHCCHWTDGCHFG